MNDAYVEWLVKRKNTAQGWIARILCILGIIVCVVAFIFIGSLGLLAEIIMCIVTYFVFKKTSVEFEYIYLTGELCVDKIMGKNKRKKVTTVDMNQMEVVAPLGHEALKDFAKKAVKCYDCTTGMNLDTVYVVYYRQDSDLLCLKFEPNQKIVDAMEMQHPRKVYKNQK